MSPVSASNSGGCGRPRGATSARRTAPALLCSAAAALLAACAGPAGRVADEEYRAARDRAAEFQTQVRTPQRHPPMLVAEGTPRFTRGSIPMPRAATLPGHIGKVSLHYPGRHSLTTVAELISRLIDIPVLMTPDALEDAAAYAPGGLARKAGSAGSAAQDPALAALRQAVEAGADQLLVTPAEHRNTLELDYDGPLAGLLDLVATRAALQWEYSGGKIVFSRLVTRAIPVKALPNGLDSTGSFDVFGSTAGDAGGSGGNVSVAFQAKSDYWAGLAETLKGLLSARASLQVDPRSGLVTVTDALTNVERVDAYVQSLNASLLRQVVLEVEVLQVTLTDQYSNGINWTAMLGRLDRGNRLSLTGPSGPGPMSGSAPGSLSFILGPSASRASPSELVAQSLQEYGQVATSYSSVVTTTNRMPVPVGSLQTQSYVRQTSAGSVNASTGATTPGSITPGTVSTGLGLVILPVILDSNRILLQTAMQVSELRDIKSFSSGAGATAQSIQLPNTVSFSSLQRVSVPAGETLVLVGYEREQTHTDDADIVRGLLPIARRGARAKQGTVVLITPRLTDR